MNNGSFALYLAVMAVVTYLIRMIPLVLVKKKITNTFLLSFLHYVPYAVLAVMTVPACFFAAEHPVSGIIGLAVAIAAAWRGFKLLPVALSAVVSALASELVILYLVPLF